MSKSTIVSKIKSIFHNSTEDHACLPFRKYSYSQSGEDLIIKHIFNSLRISHPFYIDIGAHHPFYLNNTAMFYESGSNGINIEPDPELFREFTFHRQRDINLNIGIGECVSESDFFILSTPTLNTFSKEEAIKYHSEGEYCIKKVIKVKIETFDNIISEYCNNKNLDLLTIDAEGVDELILRSLNFDKIFPLVICIETISFSDLGRGKKNTDLINYLISNGYYYYADTNINSIFVRKDKWER